MPTTISDYYRAALEQLKKEVEQTPDDHVLSMNPDERVNYLVEKFRMEEIALDASRQERMVEEEVERNLRGYDIRYDGMPGTRVRLAAIRVEVPVIPSDTLREIWKHKLAPNMLKRSTRHTFARGDL